MAALIREDQVNSGDWKPLCAVIWKVEFDCVSHNLKLLPNTTSLVRGAAGGG